MRNCLVVCFSLVAALVVVSCESLTGGCAGVGYYALQVAIRDAQGNPQALGATVTIYDGSYSAQANSSYDALNVYAADERGGRKYDIQVSKPHYADVWMRGVKTPGGGCVTANENATRLVPVVLTLAAGAPAVRSVHLLPPHILLDRAPYQSVATFTPYVDANPGTSRAVRWRITGDTGSVVMDSTTGTFRYKCLARSGYLTITAISIADSSVMGTAALAVQGHPAATNDPPCG